MSDYEEKIKNGELIYFDDAAFMAKQAKQLDLLFDLNHTRPTEQEKKERLLRAFFGAVGDGTYIELPVHANWGCNTYWGRDCYANFNLTLVDDTEIHIGDNCMFAPNVVLATAGHPILPELRRKKAQYQAPVRIGSNVWIGANAVVMPGVTVGDNSVIGAGSIVTKDIPPDVVAVGNPCRVLRPIGERDKEFFFKDRRIEQREVEKWDAPGKVIAEPGEEINL
ncbi:MAG: sugar O-acetyltransferase [Oscillospiraceae bacterium]|nr:sugar O-acetyltransferase [Oscillospiraceae bacterium]